MKNILIAVLLAVLALGFLLMPRTSNTGAKTSRELISSEMKMTRIVTTTMASDLSREYVGKEECPGGKFPGDSDWATIISQTPSYKVRPGEYRGDYLLYSHFMCAMERNTQNDDFTFDDYPSETLATIQGIDVIWGERESFLDLHMELFRPYLIPPVSDIFISHIFQYSDEEIELPSTFEDPCEAVIDIAQNGDTLEIRVAAFIALWTSYAGSVEEDRCHQTPPGDLEALEELAASGEIDAAVSLSVKLFVSLEHELYGQGFDHRFAQDNETLSQSIAVIEHELSRLESKINSHANDSELVRLAFSIPAMSLYMADIEISGEIELPDDRPIDS